MEETKVMVKKLDAQGRVSIPIGWRKEWKSSRVILMKRGKRIEITPMELVPPSSLFDSIEIPGDVDFTDPHSLKRALMELKER